MKNLWIIFSPSEARLGRGGFWNEERGWGPITEATRFASHGERELPRTDEWDAGWVADPGPRVQVYKTKEVEGERSDHE